MVRPREMTTWFLNRKLIAGTQDFEVTSSMRVAVPAQACLLTLNLEVEYFDAWVEILLYPSAFRVGRMEMDDIGPVHNAANVLSGESWLRGPVILS